MTPSGSDVPGRIRSRTVHLPDGQRIRIRLEACFWIAVDEILEREELSLGQLTTMLGNATSTRGRGAGLRNLVMHYFAPGATRDWPPRPLHPGRDTQQKGFVVSLAEFKEQGRQRD